MTDWAFAGAGWITVVHGLAVEALGDRVVGVASRSMESARQRTEQTGGAVLAYEQLPAGADLVVVATPPARHAVDALRAMAAGVGVVVEKPLCTRLDDADRLVRVVEAGGALTYAENLLFAPSVARALTEIRSLGPLTHLSARAVQPRPTWGTFTTRAWGGGVLFDLGVHPLALILRAALPARPVGVRATFERSDDVEVEDRASVQVRLDTGLVGHVEVSWRESDAVWDLQAASEHGVVFLELLPEIMLERSGEPIDLDVPTPDDDAPRIDALGYVEQLRDARRMWQNGSGSSVSDVYVGRDILEIVCAAATAARTGGEEALPFTGPRDRPPIELWEPAATTN